MMISRTSLRLIALASLLGGACSLEKGDDSASALDLVVNETGTGPSEALRYQLEKGTEQTIFVELDTSAEMNLDGKDHPRRALPTVRLELALKIEEVRKSGDFVGAIEMTGTSAHGKGDELSALKDAAARLAKLKGRFVLSPRGQLKVFELETPRAADNQARQVLANLSAALQQAFIALPEPEIASGAAWRIKDARSLNGIALEQTTEFKLFSTPGSDLTLGLVVSQTADEQEISPPGVPVELPAELREFSTNGAGKLSLDLSKPLPRGFQLKLATRAHMVLEQAGKKSDVRTTTEAVYRLGSL